MSDTSTVSFDYAIDPKGTASTIHFKGFVSDHIFNIISKKLSFYELGLLRFLAKHAKKGGTYIDIGANIGNHSVFFSKYIADEVISIEPGRTLFKILSSNLQKNSVKGKSYNLGCGREARELYLTRDDIENNWGSGHCSDEAENSTSEKIEIRPLDEVYFESQCPPVSLIKIDVEGFEFEVLAGAHRVIEKYKPQIVIEASTEDEKLKVIELLKPYGYIYVKEFNATPTHYFIHKKDRLRKPSLKLILKLLMQKFQ